MQKSAVKSVFLLTCYSAFPNSWMQIAKEWSATNPEKSVTMLLSKVR